MIRRVAASALIALAASSAAARAQDITSLCERARHPAVGAWSEFKWVGGRNDGASIRMSIVGTERREGADYLWMEIVMRDFPMGPARQQGGTPRAMPRIVSKVLVPGFGVGPSSPRATIMKLGDAPAMEMPVAQGQVGTAGAPNLDACRSAKVVGWEAVTGPAGTFRKEGHAHGLFGTPSRLCPIRTRTIRPAHLSCRNRPEPSVRPRP